MRAQNKVVVITGASMGIGEATARVFLEEGASVVLTSRDFSRAAAAQARMNSPERTLALACDVCQRKQCARGIFRAYLRNKREVVVPWWYWLALRLYELCPVIVEFGMRRMLRPADQVITEIQDTQRSSP